MGGRAALDATSRNLGGSASFDHFVAAPRGPTLVLPHGPSPTAKPTMPPAQVSGLHGWALHLLQVGCLYDRSMATSLLSNCAFVARTRPSRNQMG